MYTHVLLTTIGFVGLIATNASLAVICIGGTVETVGAAVVAWRKSSRLFGPLFAAGVLFGFAVANAMGLSLASRWIIITYILIVVAIGVQLGIMLPWQLRSNRTLPQGAVQSNVPVITASVLLCLSYCLIVGVMLFRPT